MNSPRQCGVSAYTKDQWDILTKRRADYTSEQYDALTKRDRITLQCETCDRSFKRGFGYVSDKHPASYADDIVRYFGGSAMTVYYSKSAIATDNQCPKCSQEHRAPKSVVEKIRSGKYRYNITLVVSEDCCPICQEPNADCLTECNHYYHRKCLTEWLGKVSNCPYCRRDIGIEKNE